MLPTESPEHHSLTNDSPVEVEMKVEDTVYVHNIQGSEVTKPGIIHVNLDMVA